MQEKKYGLQLRVPKSQQKQQQVRPPIPKPAGFNDDDDNDVEQEISRQAAKNKSLKDVLSLSFSLSFPNSRMIFVIRAGN